MKKRYRSDSFNYTLQLKTLEAIWTNGSHLTFNKISSSLREHVLKFLLRSKVILAMWCSNLFRCMWSHLPIKLVTINNINTILFISWFPSPFLENCQQWFECDTIFENCIINFLLISNDLIDMGSSLKKVEQTFPVRFIQ